MPRLQSLVANSALGIHLALAFGRWVPPRVGLPLARRLADFIAARRDWALVRSVRQNQWVVRGETSTEAELDQAVRETFRAQASTLYDLYHCLARPAEMESHLVYTPEILHYIAASRQPVPGQGAVLAGVHLSNFDLALHALPRRGFQGLAITLAEMPGGYKKQFDLRRASGLEMLPASVANFRLAIERLAAGEIVVTGIDRPIEHPKHFPRFFGRPAPLPVHHIYMALKAQVPIVLLVIVQEPDGRYRFHLSDPIPMQPGPDRETETITNAEAVLAVAEPFIRRMPEQWAMFLPVFP